MKDIEVCTGDAAVLVVDLDGTLCRTDTLHETLLALAATRPDALITHLVRLRHGRAVFKSHLVANHVLSGHALPLNNTVLELVRSAHAEGRKTALVTATHQRQAEAVAEATGLFDEVYGTSSDRNLKGEAKAQFLTERYGLKGFDYVGDSPADLPVWRAARKAYTVGASPSLARAAEAANPDATHLDPPTGRTRPMLRALRPHQWSKNLLLFLPLLAAHQFTSLYPVFLGFLAFCLAASAVYVINDLVDIPADRAHPRKRFRPFASGELSAVVGVAMAVWLLLAANVLAALTGSPLFVAVLLLYLALTFTYSFWLKRKLLVDVLTLAALYTIRILAGSVVAGIVLSPWLLGFSMFLFLALAAVKRQAELMGQKQDKWQGLGRAYLVGDLPILTGIAISSGQSSALVLALYITSDNVGALYVRPELLWLVVPLLLYWVLRMVMMTHRGYMTDDPIVFAARDRVSLLVIAASVAVVVAAALWE